jgi:hypothetical protein
MPPAGFEPAIPASERPQTHDLDRAATEIGLCFVSTDEYITYINRSSSTKKFYFILVPKSWTASSVGIATDYGLDDPGIESR